MYKHILWDFDGTLFDTYPVMAGVFHQMLEEQGIEEPYDEIMRHMKISMTEAHDYYHGKYQLTEEFFQQYKLRRVEQERLSCRPYEGITELCRFIHESGR